MKGIGPAIPIFLFLASAKGPLPASLNPNGFLNPVLYFFTESNLK